VRRIAAATGAFDRTIPLDQAVPNAEISTGAFGDASAASLTYRTGRNADTAISSAAEILLKPRPAYTDEARRLQIEGEVLLEVLFAASGEARVLRMVRGLGHGLDENAIAAARAIQFRPARRGDAAVDSTAVVHISFQLAY
jgi:TonB family protein